MINNTIFPENVNYSTFDLSRTHKTSFDFGKLIPIANIQTLPGDDFEIDVDSFVRGMPTLAPILDKCDLKVNAFFVPHRVLFNNFEEFISRSPNRSAFGTIQGLIQSHSHFGIPYFDLSKVQAFMRGRGSEHNKKYHFGRLLDYLGIRGNIRQNSKNTSSGYDPFNPPNDTMDIKDVSVLCSLLPVLAYNKIYMDYYIPQRWLKYHRDTGKTSLLTSLDSVLYDFQKGKSPIKLEIPSYTDYESAFPKQEDKNLLNPIVQGGLYGSSSILGVSEYQVDKKVRDFISLFTLKDVFYNHDYFTNALPLPSMSEDVLLPTFGKDNEKISRLSGWNQNALKQVGGTIRDLRQSIAAQHFFEKINVAGGRYHETLKVLWNEDINTNLLQMSEYIGGDVVPMFVNEVEQTAQIGSNSNLGDLAGKPLSAGSSKKLHVNCNEYGQVMILAHLVPKRSYANRMDKAFLQMSVDDFPFPQFEGIGDEAVYAYEIGDLGDTMNIFGYVPRYSYYKTGLDEFSGEMRNSLSQWHLGEFNNVTQVSPHFLTVNVREDIFRVPSIPDKFLGTFNIKVQARRKLSYNTPVGVTRI